MIILYRSRGRTQLSERENHSDMISRSERGRRIKRKNDRMIVRQYEIDASEIKIELLI